MVGSTENPTPVPCPHPPTPTTIVHDPESEWDPSIFKRYEVQASKKNGRYAAKFTTDRFVLPELLPEPVPGSDREEVREGEAPPAKRACVRLPTQNEQKFCGGNEGEVGEEGDVVRSVTEMGKLRTIGSSRPLLVYDQVFDLARIVSVEQMEDSEQTDEEEEQGAIPCAPRSTFISFWAAFFPMQVR